MKNKKIWVKKLTKKKNYFLNSNAIMSMVNHDRNN